MRDYADEGYTTFCDDFPKIDGKIAHILKSGYQKDSTDDKKVYDRSEAGEGDFYPSLRHIRGVKQTLTKELEAVPT